MEVSGDVAQLGAGEIRAHVARGGTTILVPLGSCERHGNPFTPLGLDSLVARSLVERAAARTGVLHTPELAFGYAPHHLGRLGEGNGTVSLRPATYQRLVGDVVRSLVFQGFDRVVLVTLHSFNVGVLEQLLIPLRQRTGAFVALYGGRESEGVEEILGSAPGRLASDLEAALAMALLGERFQAEAYLSHGYEVHAPDWLGAAFAKRPGTGLAVSFQGSDDIVLGLQDHEFVRPISHDGPLVSAATPAKGQALLDLMADHLAAFVAEVKALDVDVHRRELDWDD